MAIATTHIGKTLLLVLQLLMLGRHLGSSSDSLSVAAASDTVPRIATWIWDSTMIQDDAQVASFMAFARARAVQRAFLLVDAAIENAVFAAFVTGCKAQGVLVDALFGDARWILEQGKPSLEDQLMWMEAYQGSVDEHAKFAGMHVDIEPWGLDGWTSNRDDYIRVWHQLSSKILARGHALNLEVTADISAWLNKFDDPVTSTTLDVGMFRTYDALTIMSYRNSPAAVLSFAESAMAAANSTDKPFWLAVETNDVGEGSTVDYAGRTQADVQRDLNSIVSMAKGHPQFQGVAVHDYKAWSALQ